MCVFLCICVFVRKIGKIKFRSHKMAASGAEERKTEEMSSDDDEEVEKYNSYPFLTRIPTFQVRGLLDSPAVFPGDFMAHMLNIRVVRLPCTSVWSSDDDVDDDRPRHRLALFVPHVKYPNVIEHLEQWWTRIVDDNTISAQHFNMLKTVAELWHSLDEIPELKRWEQSHGVWKEKRVHERDFMLQDWVRYHIGLQPHDWFTLECPNVYQTLKVSNKDRREIRQDFSFYGDLNQFKFLFRHPTARTVWWIHGLWGIPSKFVTEEADGNLCRALGHPEYEKNKLMCINCSHLLKKRILLTLEDIWEFMQLNCDSETWGATPTLPLPICPDCRCVVASTKQFKKKQASVQSSQQQTAFFRKYPFRTFVVMSPCYDDE